VELAIEQEFAALQKQLEEEAAQAALVADQEREDLDLSSASALRSRLGEVRRSERQRTGADMLYMMVCEEFRRLEAPLVPALPKSGDQANFGSAPKPGALTDAAHSPQALRVVQDHVGRSIPNLSGASPGQPMQILKFTCGQAYATSALFGYVLRRAERRFRLERSLFPDVEREASSKQDADKALEDYLVSIGPGDFQDSMLSLEAQLATEAQVEALFGDLVELKAAILETLKAAPPGEDPNRYLQEASTRGDIATLRLTVGDFRRLLLEAIAFGALLCDVEARAQEGYGLTPAASTRLDKFGIETDDQGRPLV